MTPRQKYEELNLSAWLINPRWNMGEGHEDYSESSKHVMDICNHSLDLIETFKDSVYYEHAKAFYEQVKSECRYDSF